VAQIEAESIARSKTTQAHLITEELSQTKDELRKLIEENLKLS